MSAVSEWIVREYFEAQGFLVHQPCKFQAVGRTKQAEEHIGLLVQNPHAPDASAEPPAELLWGGAELRQVARAIVGIQGWHSERYSTQVLETNPEIFGFTTPDVLQAATRIIGEGPIARILCLPDLPASRQLRKNAIDLIRGKGVDGVILFRTILLELADQVDPHRTYEKSDLLQILRILKRYDLLKDAQLDLFRKQRKAAHKE
jgi:hypothetical protein